MNPEEKGDASIGQLFGALASDTSALVRQELQLASAEMTQKARQAARNAAMVSKPMGPAPKTATVSPIRGVHMPSECSTTARGSNNVAVS